MCGFGGFRATAGWGPPNSILPTRFLTGSLNGAVSRPLFPKTSPFRPVWVGAVQLIHYTPCVHGSRRLSNNNVTASVLTRSGIYTIVQTQPKAQQPSLDVSKIELSERLRRVRNPSNLALLSKSPRDKRQKGVTLSALLETMAITGKRFDEASRSLEVASPT